MVCKNCGTPFDDASRFCKKCGAAKPDMFGASTDSPFSGGKPFSAGANTAPFSDRPFSSVKPSVEVASPREEVSPAEKATPVIDKPVVSVKLSKDGNTRSEAKKAAPNQTPQRAPAIPPQPVRPPPPALPVSPHPPGSVQQKYSVQSQNYARQQGGRQHHPRDAGNNKSPNRFVVAFLMITVFIIMFVAFLVIMSRISERTFFTDVEATPSPAYTTDMASVPVD